MQQVISRPSHDGRDFSLFCPVQVFEDVSKADAGKNQRIAGIISTDELDQQGERILQEGLDFTKLLGERGFFNDDHGSKHHDLLGVPETIKQYKKGDKLPNGQIAQSNLTWAEGFLFDTEQGRKTYELARAMSGTGRSLGFSIEGTINKRSGPLGNIIARAGVKHIAITHQPVNEGTSLMTLVRSLASVNKSTTVVSAPANAKPLVRQNLAGKITNLASTSATKRRKKAKLAKFSPKLRRSLEYVYKAFPNASVDYALMLADTLDQTPQ